MTFNLKTIVLLCLVAISHLLNAQYTKTASCSQPDFDKKVNSYLSYSAPVISVEKANAKKNDYVFLDAREFEEYQVSHIPGAKYIGYDKFNLESLKDIPKDSKIIVYCSIGYRSEKIATKLIKSGYKNVFNLYGSLFEWVNEGFEVTNNLGKSTHKVHTYNRKWSQWVSSPKIEKVW